MADHSRLGRGLASLMGDVGEETTPCSRQRAQSRAARRSKISAPIRATRAAPSPRPNSTNSPPRSASAASSSRSWCAPVRGEPDNFEIIAGERRWRAAQRAGLHEVPVAVVEATDAQALEFAIIENVQRADLECDRGGDRLSGADGGIQPQPGRGGADRRQEPAACGEHAAAAQAVRAGAGAGRLRPVVGRARALAGRPAERRANRARRHQEGLERAPARGRHAQGRPRARRATLPAPRAPRTPTPRRWSGGCRMRLGLEVAVDHRADGGGTLRIKYRDLDQLDGVLRKLDRT